MSSSRIKYSIINGFASVGFFVMMLVVNFFSRRVFLDMLGDDLCGLTTLMNYTIGLLNVADLGIATAVSCALYRPIAQNDREQINEVVSLLGYLFRFVGGFIIVVGFILAFFIVDIAGDSVPEPAVYSAYFVYLFMSALTYLVNYKQFLLIASQRAYIVTALQNTTSIIKLVLQMLALWLLPINYYLFLVIEAVFAIIYSITVEWRTKKEYPWLNSHAKYGRSLIKSYGHIFTNIKQIVSHKFAGVVLLQSDSIIIAQLISLGSVTLFQNYSMLATRVVSLSAALFSGFPAAIGNLVSEDNHQKTLHVFKQYNALVHIIAAIFAFGVFYLTPDFIELWLGSEHYLLPTNVLAFVAATMYVAIVKMPLYSFLNGYGIYYDTWAPWCEVAINLVISVWGAYMWGLVGVAAGSAISTAIIAFGWKPYLLLNKGIGASVSHFYKPTSIYTIIFVVLFIAFGYMIDLCGGIPNTSFTIFGAYTLLWVGSFAAAYIGCVALINRSAREVLAIMWRKLARKK